MYINGEITTFASRMHQLVENTTDLNSFIAEGDTYYSLLDTNFQQKLEQEARLWKYRLTSSPTDLLTQLFGSAPIDNQLLDEGGDALMDENGNILFDENDDPLL